MPLGYSVQMARVGGMRAWSLSDVQADLHCTWVPGAGMLGASLVHGGEELLWQGAGVRGYARERKFMGIPFLHPWANRLDRFAYEANGHHVALDRNSPLLLLAWIHRSAGLSRWVSRNRVGDPVCQRRFAGVWAVMSARAFPRERSAVFAGRGERAIGVRGRLGLWW
jgi:hypothetical protein